MQLTELFNRSLVFEVYRCMLDNDGERLYSAKIARILKRDPGNVHRIIDKVRGWGFRMCLILRTNGINHFTRCVRLKRVARDCLMNNIYVLMKRGM
ncbi:MAG: hypothetical protein UX20_C0049G0004 [Candidatus Magasanikbacteria bacterium GW2011_GWC2_45_8]|uniref:Uncharacterized protein n=1 Tax=Candidatus Magasanikbacteria bacterium GW2011_GWC2_45_8 TaxID=1619050 RepID=A0A0G1MW91_9BACT|nr:MAG: hypothetical protein UX20_C0049G0004 [Candidatus Magasanikbacteria bacterium GW2011_GWC2_45_8]